MAELMPILRDLVRRPSVNPMNRRLQGPEIFEHQVTAYLEDYFRALGVRYERQHIATGRDNIIAFTDHQVAAPTLLFEAHQDTVPAENMTIEPYAANIVGDRLYGRGACDVKGGMTAMLGAFTRLVLERPAKAVNLVLACTIDEEHTFLGVQRLVQANLPIQMAVVAEPTQLQIVNAHKGVVRWHLETMGRSCHSSAPEQGRNAIYEMATLLSAIREYADWLCSTSVDSILGPATLSVGLIEGGSSVNIVPDRCRIEVDRRLIPGEDPQAAPKELESYLRQKLGNDFPFTSSGASMFAPPLDARLSNQLVHRLGRAIDAVKGTHRVASVPYGTDASTISEAGIPAVVFGPGDIAQAHTDDEWISLSEVEEASEILYRFVCDR
jgi:acetylornithine deacetylase